jgi:hypothetical protein
VASSDTEICNLALGHLGVLTTIADLTTEQSAEAKICRRFYENTRDSVLRDFNWPFATKIDALALVESDPNDEWDYSYRYPSDCINMRRILSGIRNESPDQRIPYKIGRDNSGRLIFTDQDDAQIEYTMRVETIEEYPPDFVYALSYHLAMYIGPHVTKGDPFKIIDRCERMYSWLMTKAQAQAANEEQPDVLPESEFIRARE